MKRTVDIRTLEFTSPHPALSHQVPHRQRIISQALHSQQYTPVDHALRGSKVVRKTSQKQTSPIKNHSPLRKKTPPKLSSKDRDRLCRSQNGRRSLSRGRERYSESQQAKVGKSHSISRYETRRDGEQVAGEEGVHPSFHITSQSRKLFTGVAELPKEKMKTQPANPLNLKSQLMRRICKKITFMKKMTAEEDGLALPADPAPSPSPSKSLFRFDKFYEHCVRNINRCINTYQKEMTREKDKKYFELKVEGGILARELMQLRNGIAQKQRQVRPDYNLGVVGSGIEVRSFEKTQSHRPSSSHFHKKAKKITKGLTHPHQNNPFRMDDMHGWEFGIERNEDFYL